MDVDWCRARTVQMKVGIGKQKVRGEWKWVVSYRVNGKRKRIHFTSKAAAEAEGFRLRKEIADAGTAWINLTEFERNDLIRIYRECRNRNITLDGLLQIASEKPSAKSPLLQDAIVELLDSKTKAGRSPQYVSTLKCVLNQFAFGKPFEIGAITFQTVEAFIHSRPLPYRQTLRSRLSTLFKFAIRRGYRPDNPCDRLEPITIARSSPTIFTPNELSKCLQWLKAEAPQALPWFILTTCCGLRPEEAEKTCRADIHIKEGWIKVEAQTTKIRQRRVVYPKTEAMALLSKSLRGGKLPLGAMATRRAVAGWRWKNKSGTHYRPGLRQALGWKVWPRDITRHSAASYWLADCESTAAVARYLGHSETILLRHYAALVTKEEAKSFWAATEP